MDSNSIEALPDLDELAGVVSTAVHGMDDPLDYLTEALYIHYMKSVPSAVRCAAQEKAKELLRAFEFSKSMPDPKRSLFRSIRAALEPPAVLFKQMVSDLRYGTRR